MTDNAPDTRSEAVRILALTHEQFRYTSDNSTVYSWPMKPKTHIKTAATLRALVAERDMQKNSSEKMTEFYEHRGRLLEQEYARAEAAKAAITTALERLDASLFTNAEHQQAKDILRGALKRDTEQRKS